MTQSLDKNYEGLYGAPLPFGQRPALILIDFVQAYFDTASPLYADVEDALVSAIKIRDAAREAGVPIIYTNVVYNNPSDGGRFIEKVPALEMFQKGGPMGDWPEGLIPAKDELIISKHYPSAFFSTPLAELLHEKNCDSVILTGLTTSGCVRASCVDAMSSGFRTFVVADACGDRHAAPHEANLFDMNAKYASVIDEATALDYLTKFCD